MHLLYWILPPVILLLIVYFWFPGLLYGLFLWFERFRAGWSEKIVTIENRPVYYLDSDKDPAPDREILLFVHGFGGDRDNRGVLLPICRVNTVVSLLIYRDSAQALWITPIKPFCLNRLSGFAPSWISWGSIVHLFGFSMGGHLAVHFAVKYPQRVHSLLLFDPSGIEQGRHSDHFKLLAQGVNCLAPSDLKGYDRMFEMLFTKRPFVPGPLKRFLVNRPSVILHFS